MYDARVIDSFPNTSLHLSFTEFKLPIATGLSSIGSFDADAVIVESLVSVHDHGEWVADIDVLGCLSQQELQHAELSNCSHSCAQARSIRSNLRLASIDRWDELIDGPAGLGAGITGVIRASGNWLARLAATCISIQRRYRTVVLSKTPICQQCLAFQCVWLESVAGKAAAENASSDKHSTDSY